MIVVVVFFMFFVLDSASEADLLNSGDFTLINAARLPGVQGLDAQAAGQAPFSDPITTPPLPTSEGILGFVSAVTFFAVRPHQSCHCEPPSTTAAINAFPVTWAETASPSRPVRM